MAQHVTPEEIAAFREKMRETVLAIAPESQRQAFDAALDAASRTCEAQGIPSLAFYQMLALKLGQAIGGQPGLDVEEMEEVGDALCFLLRSAVQLAALARQDETGSSLVVLVPAGRA